VGVNGHVHGLLGLQAPAFPGHLYVVVQQRHQVALLSAEVAALAQLPVVLHVDDERCNLPVAGNLVSGHDHLARFQPQRGGLRDLLGLARHHPKLGDPAIHGVLDPVCVSEDRKPAAAPAFESPQEFWMMNPSGV
jgi:hypothetical protein